mmetsp:Transcript_53364/g.79309  ORF Transcript_53364/g.79309 Transcript_53364/m.79309 type:complete len:133 (-) Transcript_53364:583-981(-)
MCAAEADLLDVRNRSGRKSVCTLLEGRLSGSPVVKCAIMHARGNGTEPKSQAENLLRLVNTASSTVRPVELGECEVLYGRAGYLQTILVIGNDLSTPFFVREVACEIVRETITAGMANTKKVDQSVIGSLWD